jgi:hypothetical protein
MKFSSLLTEVEITIDLQRVYPGKDKVRNVVAEFSPKKDCE